ncbi:hypothetical protein CEXT_132351 [Caerostris extrusa]|uniref:Uncharacterized protein n=1 Tax=Caerostris extrusa TaxID=172846 RepID=A0AAV4UAM6_CAEEX|nr:hypothetical protein CEXT_132351 [Caerostris extrusa]
MRRIFFVVNNTHSTAVKTELQGQVDGWNTHKNNTFRARRGKSVPQIHRVLRAKTSAFTVRRDNPVASPARRSAQVGRVTTLWLRAFFVPGIARRRQGGR